MAFISTLNLQGTTVWQREKEESETQRRKHQEQTQIVVIKGLDASLKILLYSLNSNR